MKNVFKFAVVFVLALLISSCHNTIEKMEKAEEFYRLNGYEIIASKQGEGEVRALEDNKEACDYFILVKKNGTYYLDTEFKSKGKSAVKIYPNETGLDCRTLEVSFKDGVKGTLRQLDSEYNHVPSFNNIRFHDSQNIDGKDLLFELNYYSGDFYLIGGQFVLVLTSKFKGWNNTGFSCTESFTFADLYDNSDYLRTFTLENYPFTLEEEFSLKDLSFLGFSNMALKKEDYPWQQIIETLGNSSQITEDYYNIYIPSSWIGTPKMDLIKECIDNDIEEKEEELFLEQLREQERQEMEARQREKEEMIKYVEDNGIDFNDMHKDYNNPIKAEKKYTIGEEILLKIRIDKIEYSSSGYTYVLSWLGSFVNNAYVYTNDNNFSELDYPQIVWIRAKYYSRHEAWDSSVTYKFTDAQLLLHKKPGLFE